MGVSAALSINALTTSSEMRKVANILYTLRIRSQQFHAQQKDGITSSRRRRQAPTHLVLKGTRWGPIHTFLRVGRIVFLQVSDNTKKGRGAARRGDKKGMRWIFFPWRRQEQLCLAMLVVVTSLRAPSSTARILSRRAASIISAPLSTSPLVERLCSDADPVIRPTLDSRSIQLVRLTSNGLVCLLVSDADADEAGAALSVRAGSFDDTRPGMAHFHEHMLFLGTEKFPEEDEFESFLSANGGHSNAYTADEETLFYASVNSEALGGCLERFGQFFQTPLMDQDRVEREVEAVDAEHSMALLDDGWRLMSVMKTAVNPEHPYAKFHTGTLDTLLPEESVEPLHSDLVAFNNRHYKSNKMRLCVVGKEAMPDLEKMVADAFGGIERDEDCPETTADELRRARAQSRPDPAWSVGRRIDVVPVRELREVHLMWPLPARQVVLEEWDATPDTVASHLLGHEGAKTLHSVLREKGYIESLTCGMSTRLDDAQLFELGLELTEVGASELDEVLKSCWRWIGVVASATDDQLTVRAEELRSLHATRFNYSERGAAADFASVAAEAMWQFPRQPLVGPSVVGPDADHVPFRRLFNILTDPTKALLVVLLPREEDEEESTPQHSKETWNIEKWHGARYKSRPFSDSEVDSFRSEATKGEDEQLAIPAPNVFVPRRFDVSSTWPRGVYRVDRNLIPGGGSGNESMITVWRRNDYADAAESVRRAPKAQVKALWRWQDKGGSSPLALGLVKSICALVSAELNHDRYDATLAGLQFSYDVTRRGLSISAFGFSDRLPDVFHLAKDGLRNTARSILDSPQEDETLKRKFDLDRAELGRRCDDRSRDEPVSVASSWSALVIDAASIGADDLATAVRSDECTLRNAAKRLTELLSSPLEMYVAGELEDSEKLYEGLPTDASSASTSSEGDSANVGDQCVLLDAGADVAVELRALRPSEPPGPAFVDGSASATFSEEKGEEFDPNSGVKMAWQLWRGGDDESAVSAGWLSADERDAAGSLLGHLASPSAFQQLRTVEQLGYVADASIEARYGVTHFYCVVQSTKLGPIEIEERILSWLGKFRQEIESLSEEQVSQRANGLAESIAVRPGSLGDVVSRDWFEISSGRRRFSHPAKRVRQLKEHTSKAHLLKVLDDLILDTDSRRLLKSRVYANNRLPVTGDQTEEEKDEQSQEISEEKKTVLLRSLEDIAAFKAGRLRWEPAIRWDEGRSAEDPALP